MTDVLTALAATIHSRRTEAIDGRVSYTRQLLDGGPATCARKFGEEAVELIIAALSPAEAAPSSQPHLLSQSKEDLTSEAADVLYHLLVLLESRDVSWSDVTAKLAARNGVSGLAEKAARSPDRSST